MAGRGGLCAVTAEQLQTLISPEDDEDRKEALEVILEDIEPEHDVATDKAWDGIQRILNRQERVEELAEPRAEAGPAGFAILGTRSLMREEDDYLMRLIPAERVAAVAAALDAVDEAAFKALYEQHCRDVYPEYDDDGLEYCWEYFEMVRDFYRDQVGNGRAVVFAVGL